MKPKHLKKAINKNNHVIDYIDNLKHRRLLGSQEILQLTAYVINNTSNYQIIEIEIVNRYFEKEEFITSYINYVLDRINNHNANYDYEFHIENPDHFVNKVIINGDYDNTVVIEQEGVLFLSGDMNIISIIEQGLDCMSNF